MAEAVGFVRSRSDGKRSETERYIISNRPYRHKYKAAKPKEAKEKGTCILRSFSFATQSKPLSGGTDFVFFE